MHNSELTEQQKVKKKTMAFNTRASALDAIGSGDDIQKKMSKRLNVNISRSSRRS